jgi:hypothetical protein
MLFFSLFFIRNIYLLRRQVSLHLFFAVKPFGQAALLRDLLAERRLAIVTALAAR